MEQESLGLGEGGPRSPGAGPRYKAGGSISHFPICEPPDPGHGAPGGGRVGFRVWTPSTTSSFPRDPGIVAAPL